MSFVIDEIDKAINGVSTVKFRGCETRPDFPENAELRVIVTHRKVVLTLDTAVKIVGANPVKHVYKLNLGNRLPYGKEIIRRAVSTKDDSLAWGPKLHEQKPHLWTIAEKHSLTSEALQELRDAINAVGEDIYKPFSPSKRKLLASALSDINVHIPYDGVKQAPTLLYR